MFTTVGCLLRSLPTDIEFDNTTGISFTCDLSDNIAAPWPSSSSVQSLSLCAPGKQWRNSYLGHRNIVRHLFWNRHMIFFTPFSGTLVFLVVTLVFHYWFQKCHYLHCLSHQNLEAQVINLHLLLKQWDSIYCFPSFISKTETKSLDSRYFKNWDWCFDVTCILHRDHLHLRTSSSSEPGASYPVVFSPCAGPRVNWIALRSCKWAFLFCPFFWSSG